MFAGLRPDGSAGDRRKGYGITIEGATRKALDAVTLKPAVSLHSAPTSCSRAAVRLPIAVVRLVAASPGIQPRAYAKTSDDHRTSPDPRPMPRSGSGPVNKVSSDRPMRDCAGI